MRFKNLERDDFLQREETLSIALSIERRLPCFTGLRLNSGMAGRFVIIRFSRSPFDSSTSLRRPSSVARQPLTRDVSLYDGGGGG